jgi:uncharacterized membrane-anchored protein
MARTRWRRRIGGDGSSAEEVAVAVVVAVVVVVFVSENDGVVGRSIVE